MNKKIVIKLPFNEFEYSIEIGKNIFKNIISFINLYYKKYKIIIISDSKVSKLYAYKLSNLLKTQLQNIDIITFPEGENSKSYKIKENIETQLIKKYCDRSTLLITIGGGVTGDLGGFIAATYMRGIPYIQIPTSLLAMVDSSIGGKVAINHKLGKNLIGAFYQPVKVIIDITTLKTLSNVNYLNGIAEIIKSALIYDKNFFNFLIKNRKKIINFSESHIKEMVYKTCLIKSKIVMKDEKENNLRKLLNFGHTIGHAIETLSKFKIPHGFCVSIGMNVESKIALNSGLLSIEEYTKILNCLKSYKLPVSIPNKYKTNEIYKQMLIDKKNINQIINFTLLKKIGKGIINQNIDKNIIFDSIEECR